jgi:ribosomal protein RSM22 (predicted rRNA methylase)
MSDDVDALAYAVVRMPATFRAVHAALTTVERHVDASIRTHLDLGGGTGASARNLLPATRRTGDGESPTSAPGAGVQQVVVPKSASRYRAARSANWGDDWPTA